jgi:HSP20 family protein
MANLVRRDTSPMNWTTNGWNPLRLMEGLLNWDPFTPMVPTSTSAGMFLPQFDVHETKDSYVFTADLPGVKEEDLEITCTGNQLLISGKRDAVELPESDSGRYHLCERTYGRFSRAFSLPEGVNRDQVNAHLKDGVLTLTVGKLPEVQPRRIQLGPKSQATA